MGFDTLILGKARLSMYVIIGEPRSVMGRRVEATLRVKDVYTFKFFMREKQFFQMIENCLMWRIKGITKFRRVTTVFGGSGGSTAVSSQFHIVPL